jgi:hypothetical protein
MKTLVLLFIYFTLACEAKTSHTWIEGKVLDTEATSYFSGATSSPPVVAYPGAPTGVDANYRTDHYYIIEVPCTGVCSGSMVYLTQEFSLWHSLGGNDKPALLVINGPVKIAIEKQLLHILDNAGREHKTKIVKQAQKP